MIKFFSQGYYKWLKNPLSSHDYENVYLTNASLDAHHDDPTFGYRFVADELEKAGYVVSENPRGSVAKSFICRWCTLWGAWLLLVASSSSCQGQW